MISFASLFVGLVFGIVNVQLVAAAGVDRVDLFLDGKQVAELRAPFMTAVDIGCEPAPHELVAVAYDAKGKRLEQVRQWVNRPRPTAEASLVLEPGRGEQGRIAHLTWRSLTAEVPKAVAVTFDGRPVPVADPSRIEVPPHDPRQVHSLRARLEFEGNVSASTEVIFGGPRTTEVFTEMTAVTVVLDADRTLPPAGELAGWFEKDGRPLEVAAVEEGPSDVVFVCEGSVLPQLQKVFQYRTDPYKPGLPADLSFRFVWPVGQLASQATMSSNLYPSTRRMTIADGNVSWVAGKRLIWPAWTRAGQRIADAVAVAALAAAEEERRRAVVLLLGPEAADGSLLTPREVSEFLAKLRVPLHVWSIGKKPSPEAPRWGGGTSLANARQFDAAVAGLVESLSRQRIVWVEGTHLPQDVIPATSAAGISLAR